MTYIITSNFECRNHQHLVNSNSCLRSSLEEAKKYIDEEVEEYRKSFSVAKEIDLK